MSSSEQPSNLSNALVANALQTSRADSVTMRGARMTRIEMDRDELK